MNSVINSNDLFLGNSAARRVCGGLERGGGLEFGRSAGALRSMRERTADQRQEGREVWVGWLGSFLRTRDARHSACTFRVHLV